MTARLLSTPVAVVPAVACVALAAAGCSVSVRATGDAGLSGSEVEARLDRVLEDRLGRAPDAIDCPEPLLAEVGAAVRCTVDVPEGSVDAVVTTTAVEGHDVELDVTVDDEPRGT
ncbi:DUF4333 domain-containing protein [Cellulomonas pakistanensis]|uniref:DUF4333 domain-containing protein n=1 Tax=Cellulomonas pakistanensis TaxID=992287 RepID=A0A919P7Y2_9CELL|nr:DUF4333 domain-containing protein [Cellulomonas pakistanensis]GIG34773.1 hypothetical protein Cpa01nite_01540 [Cellulomonas pakistanensis]